MATAFHRLPYVGRRLQTALLAVPVVMPHRPPPAVLWSVLADGSAGEGPLPLWLLTPALLSALRRSADRIDRRIAAGGISADDAGAILRRYGHVMRLANDAAAAGWWYCQGGGPAVADETGRPWDFDEVGELARAAEAAAAHNAAAERGVAAGGPPAGPGHGVRGR